MVPFTENQCTKLKVVNTVHMAIVKKTDMRKTDKERSYGRHHDITIPYVLYYCSIIEEGQNQKTSQRSSLVFGGQNLFKSLPRQLFCLGLFERKGRIHPIFPNRLRQNIQRGKELTNSVPQTDATTFALSSNSILLLCAALCRSISIFISLWG